MQAVVIGWVLDDERFKPEVRFRCAPKAKAADLVLRDLYELCEKYRSRRLSQLKAYPLLIRVQVVLDLNIRRIRGQPFRYPSTSSAVTRKCITSVGEVHKDVFAATRQEPEEDW